MTQLNAKNNINNVSQRHIACIIYPEYCAIDFSQEISYNDSSYFVINGKTYKLPHDKPVVTLKKYPPSHIEKWRINKKPVKAVCESTSHVVSYEAYETKKNELLSRQLPTDEDGEIHSLWETKEDKERYEAFINSYCVIYEEQKELVCQYIIDTIYAAKSDNKYIIPNYNLDGIKKTLCTCAAKTFAHDYLLEQLKNNNINNRKGNLTFSHGPLEYSIYTYKDDEISVHIKEGRLIVKAKNQLNIPYDTAEQILADIKQKIDEWVNKCIKTRNKGLPDLSELISTLMSIQEKIATLDVYKTERSRKREIANSFHSLIEKLTIKNK